jgi:hypothetical protein
MLNVLQFDKFVYLPQDKLLKLRAQFVKKAGHPLQFFLLVAVEHTALAGEKPVFVDRKGADNEVDKAVFHFIVA